MTSLPRKPPPQQSDEIEAGADFIALSSSEAVKENAPLRPSQQDDKSDASQNPPLPEEDPPPLPDELPPKAVEQDDGWEPVWDEHAQAFYFYNKHTKVSQWENPRIANIESTREGPTDTGPPGAEAQSVKKPVTGGYNPAIHGDYDPNADYAQKSLDAEGQDHLMQAAAANPAEVYAATGAFNRFTGKWQRADLNPDHFNDENKSHRQMNAFFDVDAAANSHDGRSLKAERSNKKLSKQELKAFREKRREKKEEKRRAWLRD